MDIDLIIFSGQWQGQQGQGRATAVRARGRGQGPARAGPGQAGQGQWQEHLVAALANRQKCCRLLTALRQGRVNIV